MELFTANRLRGEVTVPGDKSISHRAVMFGALANGTTEITDFLQSTDCLSTIDCFRRMEIEIEQTRQQVLVHGKGLRGLRAPSDALYVGNSGTTIRLLSGILCGQSFPTILSGDASLNTRPMRRILEPLTQMGADVRSKYNDNLAPLLINHGLSAGSTPAFAGIHYHTPVASAQVKSAILLAGLYAEGMTQVTEPAPSRDHTERMLNGFGASVTTSLQEDGSAVASITPCDTLHAQQIQVPGDLSSAAYLIAAGLLVPHSELLIRNVGINPTRAGFLQICKEMGADLTYLNERNLSGEPTADLLVRSSSLHGTIIEGAIIPTLIDELPILAVMGAFADGTTLIKDAAELKVKETDRIAVTTEGLRTLGASVLPTKDGMIIEGGKMLHGGTIHSHFDHRIAMAFSIAGLVADGMTTILDSDCVQISYPNFYETLQQIQR